MKTPIDYIEEMTDLQLKCCYGEIVELNRIGVLPNGVIRNTLKKINEDMKIEYLGIDYMTREIMNQIAKRWYDKM